MTDMTKEEKEQEKYLRQEARRKALESKIFKKYPTFFEAMKGLGLRDLEKNLLTYSTLA